VKEAFSSLDDRIRLLEKQPHKQNVRLALVELKEDLNRTLGQQIAERHDHHKDLNLFACRMDTKNTTSFPVSQGKVDNSADTLEGSEGVQALATVVGDGLVSPHFFSGSGLSSGRAATDNVVQGLRDLQSERPDLKKISRSVREA